MSTKTGNAVATVQATPSKLRMLKFSDVIPVVFVDGSKKDYRYDPEKDVVDPAQCSGNLVSKAGLRRSLGRMVLTFS